MKFYLFCDVHDGGQASKEGQHITLQGTGEFHVGIQEKEEVKNLIRMSSESIVEAHFELKT